MCKSVGAFEGETLKVDEWLEFGVDHGRAVFWGSPISQDGCDGWWGRGSLMMGSQTQGDGDHHAEQMRHMHGQRVATA